MRSCVLLSVLIVLAVASSVSGLIDRKPLYVDNPPDASQPGFAANWWWAKFENVGDSSFCATEPFTSNEASARVRRVPMIFERPLATVPMVLVSVTKLRAENTGSLNYHAQALDITTEGFTLEFKVFCDTFVDEVEVQWMAIG